jgi:hypothetical protein
MKKDTKEQAWAEIAEQLNTTIERLQTYWNLLRTIFG